MVEVLATCLTVVRSLSCFLNSRDTVNRSLTGIGILVFSTQSSTHLGVALSSSGKVYLYCCVGTRDSWGLIAGALRSDRHGSPGCIWDILA